MVNRVARKNLHTAQTIIDAARDILAEGGPSAVTLEAVAQRADVAVQTIYNRVGGRAAVLSAVAEQVVAANRAYLDDAYASTGTVSERLRTAALGYAAFALERPHEFHILAFPAPGLRTPGIEDLVATQNGKLAAILRDGIADGTLAPDLDPDAVATVLWRLFDGIIALAARDDGLRAGPEELVSLLYTAGSVVEYGLLARGPAGR